MTRAVPALLLGAVALAGGPPAAAEGGARPPRVAYMLECQGCHLEDGSGSPGAVPDLRENIARFAALPEGRAYLVRVPGSALSPLDDGELAAVLNWMLHRFGPAAEAQRARPFDAAEVSRHRKEPPLLDVEGERRRLLRRIEPPP